MAAAAATNAADDEVSNVVVNVITNDDVKLVLVYVFQLVLLQDMVLQTV